MKIATWNINSLRVRLPQVLDWLAAESPDVLALQETKIKDQEFPLVDFAALGYAAAYSGQAAYNGVALLARLPLLEVATGIDAFTDGEQRLLAATVAGIRIVCLYVPNGQEVGGAKYDYKLRWLAALSGQLARELERHERVVVLGDFNIAPEDRDVHDPAAWAGQILCTEPEREAFRRILSLGFDDSFRLSAQPERTFSWWDYRMGAFQRNRGLRIDLILVSAAMGRRCLRTFVDRRPRALERPSDHAPVVAEFRDD